MNNNKNVPKCIHDSVLEAFNNLESQSCASRADIRFSSKRLIMTVVAAVMCVMLVVTVAANGSFIISLFQREQELIDPHSIIINGKDEKDGITLTVEKIAEDGDYIYVYYNLHSEKPFEKGYLVYKEVKLGVEFPDDPKLVGSRAYVEMGSTNINRDIIAGVYLTYIEEPTCDIDGVLEMNKLLTGREIELSSGRKVIRTEPVEWESGKYHFIINGLQVARWADIEEAAEDEMSARVEQFEYTTDKLDVAFDFNVNCLEKMPEKVWNPGTEFTLEGCPFKLKEIRITPVNLWVTITSESDKTIEIEDQHFNPLQMFMGYNYSNEFNIYDPHQDSEVMEFRKIYERNKLWEKTYCPIIKQRQSEGSESAESISELRFSCYGKYDQRVELKDGGYDEDRIIFRFQFEQPMYQEEIEGIYICSETAIPYYAEPIENPVEILIWENK